MVADSNGDHTKINIIKKTGLRHTYATANVMGIVFYWPPTTDKRAHEWNYDNESRAVERETDGWRNSDYGMGMKVYY